MATTRMKRPHLRLACVVSLTLALTLTLCAPSVLGGQLSPHAVGTGVQFQSYSLSEALGAERATLTLFPLAYSLPVGDRVDLQLYGAYASGSVERGGLTYTLEGPVDTRIRAKYQVSPWAVVTALVNVPTGNSTHDAGEAVASGLYLYRLSTDDGVLTRKMLMLK